MEYVVLGAHSDHVGVKRPAVDHDSLRLHNAVVRTLGADDPARSVTPVEQANINRRLAEYRRAHPNSARQDSISNGADDDGSGSVALLALAEHLAATRVQPRRSLLFVWHTAEEKGALGSHWFVEHPTVPRDAMTAMLQLDMVGRSEVGLPVAVTAEGRRIIGAPDRLFVLGARRLSGDVGDALAAANRAGSRPFVLDTALDVRDHPRNHYCRSDHREYARVGIPAAEIFAGHHRDYHEVTDEAEYVDYNHLARVAAFVERAAVALANRDRRPALDGTPPDPNARCRQ